MRCAVSWASAAHRRFFAWLRVNVCNVPRVELGILSEAQVPTVGAYE